MTLPLHLISHTCVRGYRSNLIGEIAEKSKVVELLVRNESDTDRDVKNVFGEGLVVAAEILDGLSRKNWATIARRIDGIAGPILKAPPH
jgi:hypothetical protein